MVSAVGRRSEDYQYQPHQKEDTILAWLREAARHVERVDAVLLNDYHIGPAQIDGWWTYVGRKDKKIRNASPET